MDVVRSELWAIITIRGEADGEPFAGKVAVARVIRNRMQFRYQSNGTVAGTVLAPLQFSTWNATSPPRADWARAQLEDPLTAEAVRAWQASEKDEEVKDAVLYHNPAVAPNPQWKASARFIKTIGRHDFYADPVNDHKEL